MFFEIKSHLLHLLKSCLFFSKKWIDLSGFDFILTGKFRILPLNTANLNKNKNKFLEIISLVKGLHYMFETN